MNFYINTDGLMVAGYGLDEYKHKWTYSDFEKYLDEYITPSMYHYMANYVANNMTLSEKYKLGKDEYVQGELESAAVDAYFDEPINDRITMHEQMLCNLRAGKRRAELQESEAIDALLEENKPPLKTIAKEYTEFMRGLVEKYRKLVERFETEIYEEEQWFGGHEYGAENR